MVTQSSVLNNTLNVPQWVRSLKTPVCICICKYTLIHVMLLHLEKISYLWIRFYKMLTLLYIYMFYIHVACPLFSWLRLQIIWIFMLVYYKLTHIFKSRLSKSSKLIPLPSEIDEYCHVILGEWLMWNDFADA